MLGSLLGSPGVGSTGSAGPTHLRLISQGQEISQELDERTLAELGFKVASMHIETKRNLLFFLLQDLQLVFASLGTGPARGGLSKFLILLVKIYKNSKSINTGVYQTFGNKVSFGPHKCLSKEIKPCNETLISFETLSIFHQ